MRAFDFYEFVGIILPGSMLLIATGILFDIGSIDFLLIPKSGGALGVHLLTAYVLGHLIQALGNGCESLYWKAWKGMPTDWPMTRPDKKTFPLAKDAVANFCGSSPDSLTVDKWPRLVAQARSTVYTSGRAPRMQFFNGTYGMFRGLIAAGIIIALFAWKSPLSPGIVYPTVVVIIGISIYRMHRSGIHYARELFANIAELARINEAQ